MTNSHTISTAFAKTDVTPPVGKPLGRLFRNDLLAEGVQWPLYVRAMAISDGHDASLIFSVDKNRLLDPVVAEIREAVTAATGIPATRQFVACTHAHNVPFATKWLPGDDSGFAYRDVLREAAAQAAQEALDQLTPARLYSLYATVPGLAVNRRPIYATEHGEQVGTHGPTDHPDYQGQEGTPDDAFQVLLAEDMQGRILGGLTSFACHPTTLYSVPMWSADYPGALLAELAQELGGTFLFFNGAAGNMAPAPMEINGIEKAEYMGKTLAQAAIAAMPKRHEIEDPRLRHDRNIIQIHQRQPSGEQIGLARQYLTNPESHDLAQFTRDLYGYDYTMYRRNHRFQTWLCEERLGVWEWQRRRALRHPYDDVELQTVVVGDFALAGYPSEVFHEFGCCAKAASPMAETMVAELANGWHGYIPLVESFPRGGYETSLAYQSHLIPEAGNMMCQAVIDLLRTAAN